MRSAISNGAPRALWGRLIDACAIHIKAGQAWVAAGRPRDDRYAAFCAAERDYLPLRDEADRWEWNEEQRAEWSRLHRAFDP